jgi:hypothetical protein
MSNENYARLGIDPNTIPTAPENIGPAFYFPGGSILTMFASWKSRGVFSLGNLWYLGFVPGGICPENQRDFPLGAFEDPENQRRSQYFASSKFEAGWRELVGELTAVEAVVVVVLGLAEEVVSLQVSDGVPLGHAHVVVGKTKEGKICISTSASSRRPTVF